jgi:4-diphosphocytidyl-2-C-methyl-D-erythritol kinase
LVEGIGEKMTSIDLDLSNYEIRLVNPDIHISTMEAYSGIVPKTPLLSVEKIIELPIIEWKGKLKNDFEESIFLKHPELRQLKDQLYKEGAVYASMSGSGSVIFSIKYL